jgi:hypothetical protein
MKTGVGGRLGISGTLEWRDKDGNILGTTELSGSVPLEQVELIGEEAETKEKDDGNYLGK